jgi:carboxyl-terminal processing protease
VFAAALDGNKRAEMIGEHTVGSAARQRLVKLPDGSAMLLSYMRYLLPNGTAIHEKGLQPEVLVDEPDVEFGSPAPTDRTSHCRRPSSTSHRRRPPRTIRTSRRSARRERVKRLDV